MSDVVWSVDAALASFEGDEVLLREVVALLLALFEPGLENARACVAHGDFVGMRQLTHAFLPSLRMLALEAQARVWEAFEASVMAGDEVGCARLAQQVLSQWPQILVVLRGYLA